MRYPVRQIKAQNSDLPNNCAANLIIFRGKNTYTTLLGPTRAGGDWVPKIRAPKGNTQTRTKFWVWVGLGLCLNSMGIFGLGTHKVPNFLGITSFFRIANFSKNVRENFTDWFLG